MLSLAAVITAGAFVVAASVIRNVGVGEPVTLTQLQREEKARMDGELLPSHLPAAVERETREVVAVEPRPGVELVSPLESFLLARPGSPLLLLPLERAEKYVPTPENLAVWVGSVPEFADIDVATIEWTDDLRHLWGVCRQHQALRAFILEYQERERERWAAREQSVALEAELEPVLGFISVHYGDDAELWQLINAYSGDVIDEIYAEGEHADRGDEVESRWDLQRALTLAGSPSFYAVADTILGGSR